MSPPYTMLRADPSWDTIDLALPKTATAARAALKHAKKRYEDVLQQLEELLEYEQRHQQQFHHHLHHQQKNSSTSVSPVTATASSRSHQNQQQHQQQQQNEAPNKTAHDDYSIADDNFTPTPERLRHEADHNQNQQQENSTNRTKNDSDHDHQYSPKQISMTDHRIVFTSVFNPVPRHVCSSSISASRPVDPSDLNPRPTTRLRCGTASFVHPNTGTSASQHQQHQQTTTSSSSVTTTTTKTATVVNNTKNSASPIQNELVQINRSVSSQRRGSIDHYYYHGLPSANNNENEKEQEEEQVDENDQTQLLMNHSSPSPRNPKNKKNKVATIETNEEAENEEIDVYDACEKFQEQYEKPARTDSASPLSYQRRPLHHNKASASSSPSRRLKITSMARKHQQQRDVFVLNTNNENSMSLQRGFSLKNISCSPSPRIRSHNMRGGGGVDDVDTTGTTMMIKGEGSIRRCQEKNLLKTQQQQLTSSSSTNFYDTVIVFGIASVFVTAALKFNIVEL